MKNIRIIEDLLGKYQKNTEEIKEEKGETHRKNRPNVLEKQNIEEIKRKFKENIV